MTPAHRTPATDGRPDTPAADPRADMWPVTFDGKLGWLHRPAGPSQSDVGVVICAPLGRDARCAHRPLKLWADRLATAGYATLRYDHADTGESLDAPGGGGAVGDWLAGVHAAVTCLKAQTGVSQVVVGGVRIGATLAAVAAQDFEGIDGLMLLAPVTAGRGWLRELRLSASLTGVGREPEAGGVDTDGLVLSGATVKQLTNLDLRTLRRAPRRVLLLAQNETAATPAAHLTALGAQVDQDVFQGYDELFQDSHSNQAPQAAFARTVDWLNAAFPANHAARPAKAAPPPAILTPPGAVEDVVTFGAGLWGVLCRPASGDPGQRGVIFLNSGGDPRAGIGRFAVESGRKLAQLGVPSLRFDFAGLGDSADPPAETPRHVYETPRAPDIAAAIAVMHNAGFTDLTLVGVCAGAHHALHGAINDARVQAALLVSPAKLLWRPGDSMEFGRWDDGRSTRAYIVKARQAETWIRLLTGAIHIATVARTLALRFIKRLTRRDDPRAAGLRAQVAGLAARGGRVTMLMGVDDISLDEVETYFGRCGAHLTQRPGMSVRVVPGLDHGLALSASRQTTLKTLLEMLDLPAG